MTISEEDQKLINKIHGLLAMTDEWMEPEVVRVQAGSDIAEDDRQTYPYQLSHAVQQSIGTAVDHLHSMRSALWDSKRELLSLHTYAPFTLTRGALENASTAIWMLCPEDPTERVLRRLRYEMASIKTTESLLAELGTPQNEGLENKRKRVRGLAESAGIDARKLKSKPQYKEYLEEAGRYTGLTDGDNNLVYIYWKLCSAVAHGDTWVLRLFDLEPLGPGALGVTNYRATAPTPMLHMGIGAALQLAGRAKDLLNRRCTTPPQRTP
ncbi:hypothetical protein [Micromonospora sp. NRRL B-16802]|uniref:hypothetical protein n=1 Tax=Micromonospora sp. NRRL B-16802 TaxID=1415541 RepID=UPI000A97F5D2|nr:hypothetical protein [Micromonospora sp. NRRL B-16802]